MRPTSTDARLGVATPTEDVRHLVESMGDAAVPIVVEVSRYQSTGGRGTPAARRWLRRFLTTSSCSDVSEPRADRGGTGVMHKSPMVALVAIAICASYVTLDLAGQSMSRLSASERQGTGNPRESHLIIDTDAGVDDLLAIAFLVTQPNVTIDAITVVNGLAHVKPGAQNILRLLQIVKRQDIPVYEGATQPFPGGTDFDAEWRKTADTLPGVTLPPTSATPRSDAITYLARRFASPSNRFTLLALGPHTNLASALAKTNGSFAGVGRMAMMGGTVFVAGNVGIDHNTTAEWNMFADPKAASHVFTSGLPISMVPLDATNQVPIGKSFLAAAGKLRSPLGQVVAQLLTLGYDSNDGSYFAWDPLAGASVVDPSIVTASINGIDLLTTPPEAGRTKHDSSSTHKMSVATKANPGAFQRMFLGAF